MTSFIILIAVLILSIGVAIGITIGINITRIPNKPFDNE